MAGDKLSKCIWQVDIFTLAELCVEWRDAQEECQGQYWKRVPTHGTTEGGLMLNTAEKMERRYWLSAVIE